MEIIDIGLNDLEPIKLNLNEGPDSGTSIGPGIELLMNENRKRSSGGALNIDLGELENLENELNELSSNSQPASSSNSTAKKLSGFASNLFNFGGFGGGDKSSSTTASPPVHVDTDYTTDSNLGYATKETIGNAKTWDGFSKMNEIPPETLRASASASKLTDRERRRKKRMMIKKLEEWHEKGTIKNISNFNMDSSYEEVEDEYETALEDKRKKDSIKLQGWWFITFVNSIEYANAAFNPFDLNLDGWGEQVSEDIESYEEIFSELHEKYKGGKLSPELSLLLRLGFSAAVVNFTNKALSTATPGFNDVIRQSPELMKMFTSATVDAMKQQSPGFSMASNLMNQPDQIHKSFGPPPPPIETKHQPPPPSSQRPGNVAPTNRQDISMARGAMFRESGVDINHSFSELRSSVPPPQAPLPPPSNARTSAMPPQPQPQHQQQVPPSQPPMRMEMRGPQNIDLDNILSGLKTKNGTSAPASVPVPGPAPTPAPAPTFSFSAPPSQESEIPPISTIINTDDDSFISISSLKDLQNSNPPKKSRGRRKSDKNTISLDI